MPYCIYMTDDHPLMRRGYRSRVGSEHDLWIFGEAGTVERQAPLWLHALMMSRAACMEAR